jgi:heme-degrading monooxygenase HmoA
MSAGIVRLGRAFAKLVFIHPKSVKGESIMATMLVQIKVKDYTEWKKVFDTGSEMRTSNGELSHQIYHDARDPNKVTALYRWDSLANAQKFAQSPELKAAMMQAGVQGPADVSFLNEA